MFGTRKQPWYALLLLLTIAFTLAALVSLGANPKAETPNLMGYKGISSLAPISTLLFLAASFITCKLRVRYFLIK
jgi:hypothetical protein